MQAKLKECPFCGSKSVVIEDNPDIITGEEDWLIICNGCESAFLGSNDAIPCTKAELVDRWNSRAGTERVSGEWIEDDYGYNRCSECGYEHELPEKKTPYCPGCGANMDPDL